MLGALALPLLLILLAITLIGCLLWPVVGLAVAAGTVLGFTALATLIGRSIPNLPRLTPVGQLALGTAAIVLVSNLPYLGPVLASLAPPRGTPSQAAAADVLALLDAQPGSTSPPAAAQSLKAPRL